jgi:hypothetical protein
MKVRPPVCNQPADGLLRSLFVFSQQHWTLHAERKRPKHQEKAEVQELRGQRPREERRQGDEVSTL